MVLDFMLQFNDKFCPFFFTFVCYRLKLLDSILGGLSQVSREDENEADSVSESCSLLYELQFLIMLLKIMTSVSVSSVPSLLIFIANDVNMIKHILYIHYIRF